MGLAVIQARLDQAHRKTTAASQQVQHIIGMPLQLIIMGMLQSFIIFIISAQQFFIMSMFIPAMGIILQVMPSAIMVHSIMHFIIGIGMFMGIMLSIIIGMAMAAGDMHIIDRLPHCIIIGMPQFIIICIISALFLNIAMSMPAAGFMVQVMQSSITSQVMTAIIIGMPIIGMVLLIMGIDIGICIAFIMEQSSFNFWWGKLDGGDSKRMCVGGKVLAKQHKVLWEPWEWLEAGLFVCYCKFMSAIAAV